MAKRKPVRTRGKLKLSEYFQELDEGQYVAVKIEKAMQARFPQRIQGRTGIVESKRGKSYVIKMNDGAKVKSFIVEPVHLKKINAMEKIK